MARERAETEVYSAADSDILAVTDSVNVAWGYGTGTNYTNGYDDMNRLLMAVPSGKSWSYTYAYDRYGNRWQQNLVGTGGSGPQFSTTFDANNHVSDGTVNYDAAGNVMQDAFNTYTYDSQNQMISSLSRSSGSLTCYFYDAFGHRVQKTTGATSCGYPFVGGTSLYYVYDTAGNVIDEVSAPSGGTGTWTRQEIYAAGRHLATFNASAGQAYWDFSDWLGTERARVNAVTGAVAETCTSLPWGDNLQCTGADQSPLHFTGKERDSESGLDNFGARYNSSQYGRFMSPDPLAAHTEDPQTLNRYAYVANNPPNRTDPTGLDWYLGCATSDHSGCTQVQIDPNSKKSTQWVQADSNGNATIVTSDSIRAGQNSATVSQNGVVINGNSEGIYFDNPASHTTDSNGNDVNDNPITLQGNASQGLGGFSFNVNGNCGGTCLSSGSLQFNGTPDQARAALNGAGAWNYGFWDAINYHHPFSDQFRFDSGPSLHVSVPSDYLLVGPDTQSIIRNPASTVPASGNFHTDAKTGASHFWCANFGIGCSQ
ncbi:MAG: RHS repeat-associated core domain-containing protein [Candidatus Acidiferrales bacterium]